jgi:hypothetical protein
VREDLLLGQALRQVELASEAHVLGNLALEDLLHGGHADGGEHRVEVRGGDGGVAAQGAAVRLATEGGGIRLRVHQLLALGGVGEAQLDQPALAVRVVVDLLRVVGERLVDLDDLTGQRRDDV